MSICDIENLKRGDWIEVVIYDSMSCFGVVTKNEHGKIGIHIKQVIDVCYSNQSIYSRDIEVDYLEICEIKNVSDKVKELVKYDSKNNYLNLLKKFKGNYYCIKRYLKR